MRTISRVNVLFFAGLLAAAAGCDAQPVSLVNVELQVDNTGYSEEDFAIVSDMTVICQIRVLQGSPVDMRLGPKGDPTSFKSAFSGDQVRERTVSGTLEKGNYAIRIRESSPKESGVKNATVLVTLKGTPTRALRRR